MKRYSYNRNHEYTIDGFSPHIKPDDGGEYVSYETAKALRDALEDAYWALEEMRDKRAESLAALRALQQADEE